MYRCLLIGAGGIGGRWIREFLPVHRERVRVSAIADISPAARKEAGDDVGLPASERYPTMDAAFAGAEADFCVVAVPPEHHRRAVMGAVGRGLPVLSEKPISDKFAEVREIAAAVREAGIKMAVIQNHRYTPRTVAFKQVLRSGRLGRLQHLLVRFQADYRKYGSWGTDFGLSDFRHEMPDPLVIDGSIHHFDAIRNLTGGDCRTVSGLAWNAPWGSFKGMSSGLYLFAMDNDTRASYEGNMSGAGQQNVWHHEYYRAECEDGALTIDADHILRLQRAGMPDEIVPFGELPLIGHQQVIGDFLDWLDGGDAPETVLDDNVKSMAMVFAAVAAGKTGKTVAAADFTPG
jgi:predicted dehydrogenase